MSNRQPSKQNPRCKYTGILPSSEFSADIRTFIVGMLTNLGVLPVERIQSMLQMFVPPPNPYNRTEEELRTFLSEEVKKGKLEVVKGEGGGYKLVQP